VVSPPETAAVRAFFDAWTSGDLQAMLGVVHPDIEARPLLGLLWGSSEYHGRDGVSAWFADSRGLGDRFEIVVEEIRDARCDAVAFVRVIVHEGDTAYDARVAVVCGFQDGLIDSMAGRDAEEVKEALDVLERRAAI
jgi:ketosteroid isomerase-like protein